MTASAAAVPGIRPGPAARRAFRTPAHARSQEGGAARRAGASGRRAGAGRGAGPGSGTDRAHCCSAAGSALRRITSAYQWALALGMRRWVE